mmetsp:Transcript_17514/g.52569  ORF Transcript_17514/g.52569 Transcript_17514/m.52569 type:complete len:343 (-) Transcript_17514:436-1464(-)
MGALVGGCGVELADAVEHVALKLHGYLAVLDHADLEGSHLEVAPQVGLNAAAHALQHNEVGVSCDLIELGGHLLEVDDAVVSAGGGNREGALSQGVREGGVHLRHVLQPHPELSGGHVIDGCNLVGGDNHSDAAADELACEGHHAHDDVGAGVVAEHDGLLEGCALALGQGVQQQVQVVHTPGARVQVVPGVLELGHLARVVHVSARSGSQVEDVAGNDATHHRLKALPFVGDGVDLLQQLWQEGDGQCSLGRLHRLEAVRKALLPQAPIPHGGQADAVDGVGGKAGEGLLGVGLDVLQHLLVVLEEPVCRCLALRLGDILVFHGHLVKLGAAAAENLHPCL